MYDDGVTSTSWPPSPARASTATRDRPRRSCSSATRTRPSGSRRWSASRPSTGGGSIPDEGTRGAVDHPVWNGQLKREYPECDTWRAAVLKRITKERPALVVVVNSKFATFEIHGREATASQTAAGWGEALASTLRTVSADAGHVVLIGDTPQSTLDPPVCLSAHLDDVLACATSPRAEAIDVTRLEADRTAAVAAAVQFVDPTPWVCPSEPCPVVIGSLLVYHDGGHMTRTFSAALAPYLGAVLPRIGAGD